MFRHTTFDRWYKNEFLKSDLTSIGSGISIGIGTAVLLVEARNQTNF